MASSFCYASKILFNVVPRFSLFYQRKQQNDDSFHFEVRSRRIVNHFPAKAPGRETLECRYVFMQILFIGVD